jgi:hypothetical protein
LMAADEHIYANRLRKNCFCTRDWRERRDARIRVLKAEAPRLTLVSRFTPHVSRLLFSILLRLQRSFFGKQHRMFHS